MVTSCLCVIGSDARLTVCGSPQAYAEREANLMLC